MERKSKTILVFCIAQSKVKKTNEDTYRQESEKVGSRKRKGSKEEGRR